MDAEPARDRVWALILEEAELLAAAAACDPTDVAAVALLRARWNAEQVNIALSLADARRRLGRKWPTLAPRMLADRAGAEMASSELAARHKASRFAAAGIRQPVLDLCCGIGADGMGTAALGVEGIDSDPSRVAMARHNFALVSPGGAARPGRAEDEAVAGRLVHIDPQRRSGSRRAWRVRDAEPGPETLAAIAKASAGCAIKLGPGADADELPEPLASGELEYISENGRLTQCVVWTGTLQAGKRTATLLRDGSEAATLRGEEAMGEPPSVEAAWTGWFVHEIDPAVERAGLLGRLCDEVGAPMLHPRVGLLAGDEPIDSPWLRPFQLIERMPWRERRVAAWLRDHDAGTVQVKTRGGVVDPDRVQAALRGPGDAPFVVFVLRLGRRVEALVCARKG